MERRMARGMRHGAWSMEHGAWGKGHGAWDLGVTWIVGIGCQKLAAGVIHFEVLCET